MDLLARKIISTILLFCFSSTIFHFHLHAHSHTNVGGQVINQHDELNYHDSNECEKCLNKNNKIGLQYSANNFLNNSLLQPKHNSKNSTRYVLHFNIYSRPPPFNFL